VPLEFEETAQYQDGPHTNIVSKFPLHDASGNCYAICGIATDISERVRMQERLREAERHFRGLVESVQAIIWLGDPLTFQFHYINAQAEALLGYPVARWISEPNFWAEHIHPEDRERAVSYCARSVAELRDHQFEYRMLAADGRTVWLRDIVRVYADRGRPRQLYGVMIDITQSKLMEERLNAYAAELKTLSRRLAEAQEDERRRLSRELHDQVGQNLTALSINLDLIRNGLPAGADGLRARIADSVGLIEATAESIEGLLAELRPPMLDNYGLVAALRWYATLYSKRTGVCTRVEAPKALPELSPAIEAALFRIAQEALTNTAKHAGAGSATVEVAVDGATLRLKIADDGRGFDPAILNEPAKAARRGLAGMRERALAVGGRIDIDSSPGGGTRIEVEIAEGAWR
jgi:two-component system sensor histidine kinase UhpB